MTATQKTFGNTPDQHDPPPNLDALQRLASMMRAPSHNVKLKSEVLRSEHLDILLPAWAELCARSIEDNVYYSPRYSQALLTGLERDKNVEFATIWDGSRLVAMLPFTQPRVAIPVLRAAGQAWESKHTFSCMPLLDNVLEHEAAQALLELLSETRPGEWIIPLVNIDGKACQALISALSVRRKPWLFANAFRRATLEIGPGFDEHMDRHVDSKRRKRLARNRRRLEQLGRVSHESHTWGEGLDRAVSAFLSIESRGWKGQRGTALACTEHGRQFAKRAFGGNELNSSVRADVLMLDDAPIAVSLIALSGRTGFAVKACYDESYRSYSPGLLLEIEIIRSFLSEDWANRLDSATTGEHVLDGLWSDRIEVADLIFSLAPRHSALRLPAYRLSNRLSESARNGLKRLVRRSHA